MENRRTREKTALVLSGGGSRGAYQIGVWQALKEMGIHIDMVTGTSAGAVNGAVIVQGLFETACEMWKKLETNMVFDFSEALKNRGAKYTDFKEMLAEILDEETIRSSPVEFGMVTVEFPAMEPRYLWKEEIPEGQLLDYILASASCFPAVTSYEIGQSKFIDGGYSDNMPVGMAQDRGAERIIAVNLDAMGVVHKEQLQETERLTVIQSHWNLGNWLAFDTANSRRIMRLGYLDTMRAFDAYDGEYYCFFKGAMDRRYLQGAEQAAAIFELSPELIYSREIFERSLLDAFDAYERKERQELEAVDRLLEKTVLAKSPVHGFLANLAKLPPANSKTLLLLIARHLKGTHVRRSLLLSRPALALLSKEIGAAYDLVRAGLV